MRAARPLVASILCALLAGPACAPRLRRLDVITDVDANDHAATRLDLVFVRSAAALSILPRTAPEWFARRRALLDGAAADLEVVSLEIPPAFVLVRVKIPDSARRASFARAYADYSDPAGQHFLDLSGFTEVTLHLRFGDLIFGPAPTR